MPSSKLSSIETAAEGSKQLQPSLQEIEQWQTCSDRLISDFYSGLATLPTYREITPDQMTEFETQTQACSDFPDLLKLVFKHMTRSGILTSGPGHMAFVPGGGLYSGAVSDHIAAAINAFSADSFASPIAVKIHEDVIQFFCSMVGYDKHSWGDVTSGGSHATLTAFWTARESRSIRAKDYERTVAYLSEQTHHCCEKSLRILFGSDLIIRKVPLSEHAMSSAALCTLIEQDRASGLLPFLVVATAGTTNLGRIDPLDEIANIAEKEGLWLHIDAAYGGFFLLCEELKPKFSGISRADSIVLDPHKGQRA
ncbi:MAG: hypothetical protein EOP10_05340 [Proteobacteria bacterium]|nr:MAG: hypothetical protein EOP10_05340 [Pseudomonadota bacterium]